MKKTDSVPAMLTVKESVLNRNASELIGRDFIKRINDYGNMLAKRGVDLASDPTPGPSTENLLGYQMGTADVRRDDRGDLLRDADNTFYGGGHVPVPTPTPTPTTRMYQYGTSSVDDFGSPFFKRNAVSQITGLRSPPQRFISNYSGGPSAYGSQGILGPDQNLAYQAALSRPQRSDLTTITLPSGGIASVPSSSAERTIQGVAQRIQGFSQPSFQTFAASKPMTHTEMAADIARRNLTATGSSLGTPQNNPLPSGVQPYISPEEAAQKGLQWTGGTQGWQPYVSPQQMTDQNLQYTGGPSSGSINAPSQTTHFLPPGFSSTTGSSGAPNSTPNDIHFLPPGFSSVQGYTNPMTKQLQEGYGSAYGY